MHKFKIRSDFKPCSDQPAAIDKLVEGIMQGLGDRLFLGLQVPGKTFTMANVIEKGAKAHTGYCSQ